jgi:hypothetical protein
MKTKASQTQITKLFNIDRMDGLDPTDIGTIGEHFVASIVGGFGYDVVKANGKGYDLLVLDGERTVRVDVKTARTNAVKQSFWIGKGAGRTEERRGFEGENVDLFAFLCLETLGLVFRPSTDYIGKKLVYLKVDERITDPYESWKEAVASV